MPFADGASPEVIAKDAGVVALADSRTNSMTGSFLRASLFTSVISFGVAALAIGLGVLFALLGFALVKVSTPTVEAATSSRRASSGEAVVATA